MKPRSLSPVAAVKVTSNVILSSLAPIASAIIAADSANTSLAPDALGEPWGVGVLRETHRGLGARRRVGRTVHRFRDPNFVHPLAGPAEHHADEICHARVSAAAEDRGIALLASLSDPLTVL